MGDDARHHSDNRETGGVAIDTVVGGIHDSVLAGRDAIISIFTGADQRRAERNRRAMLALVRNTWIKGVLEHSVSSAVMIDLGLETRPSAVDHPWGLLLQTSDQPNRCLPRGTKIVDVFDEMNGALLILGEPGSGKTTMLLELARDCVQRAERDPTLAIPVVFNLSSWVEASQPIAEWLVEELNTKYYVPRQTGRAWLASDELLLLLDGLDEVKPDLREACVGAINDFRQEHGVSPLVVCSRVDDYAALATRLRFQGAIVLQPLTPEQIHEYLERAGPELHAVRSALERDAALQELARSPLLLSIMTLAYRGISMGDLRGPGTTEAHRRHLLDTYVEQMFRRRPAHQRYSPDDTVYWLSWLATRMTQHGQTVFIVEQMQPTWLTTSSQKRLYLMVSRAAIGVLAGLLGGLMLGVLSLLLVQPLSLALQGWPWLVAVSVAISQSAQFAASLGLQLGVLLGLGGLLAGLVYALWSVDRCAAETIEIIDAVEWSWPAVLAEIGKRIRMWLANLRTPGALNDGNIAPAQLIVQLASSLSLGLRGIVMDDPMYAGGGLHQSLKHATVAAVAGILYGIAFVLALQFVLDLQRVVSVMAAMAAYPLAGQSLAPLMHEWLLGTASLAALLAPVYGLPAAFRFGGAGYLKHLALRIVLSRDSCCPWHYRDFLDHAAERILLRKVGRGYTFIHRLLLDYFAMRGYERSQ